MGAAQGERSLVFFCVWGRTSLSRLRDRRDPENAPEP